MFEHKTPLTSAIEEGEAWQRSPFVQGLLAGAKGALIGGPTAAVIQLARGKSPILGAVLGAAATGLAAGLGKAVQQDIENQEQEAILRYHSERIKSREPMFFLPPPQRFGTLFSRLHAKEHGWEER